MVVTDELDEHEETTIWPKYGWIDGPRIKNDRV